MTEPTPPAIPGLQILRERDAAGPTRAFLARQTRMDRLVVVKIGDPDDPRTADALRREADLGGRAGAEAAVGVIDAGTTAEGVPYLVVERLEGDRLADLLRTRHLWRDAARIAAALARLLARLHAVDLRLARLDPAAIVRTPDGGMRVADLRVLAPAPKDAAAPADLEAVERVLRHLLRGRRCPPALGAVLGALKGGAYASAADLARDLEEAAGESPDRIEDAVPGPRRPGRRIRIRPARSRGPSAVAAGIGVGGIIAAGLLVWAIVGRPGRTSAPSGEKPSAAPGRPRATAKEQPGPAQPAAPDPTVEAFEQCKRDLAPQLLAGELGRAEERLIAWMGAHPEGRGARAAQAYLEELRRLSARAADAARTRAQVLADAGQVEDAIALLRSAAAKATARFARDLERSARALEARIDERIITDAVSVAREAIVALRTASALAVLEEKAGKARGERAAARVKALCEDLEAADAAWRTISAGIAASAGRTIPYRVASPTGEWTAAKGKLEGMEGREVILEDPAAPARGMPRVPMRAIDPKALLEIAGKGGAPSAGRGLALILAGLGDVWAAASLDPAAAGRGDGLALAGLWAHGAARGIRAGLARARAAIAEGRREGAASALAEIVLLYRHAPAYAAARPEIEALIGQALPAPEGGSASIEGRFHAARVDTREGALVLGYAFERAEEGGDWRPTEGSIACVEFGRLCVAGRAILLGEGGAAPPLFRDRVSIRARAALASVEDPGLGIAVWAGSPAGETLFRVGRIHPEAARELPRCAILAKPRVLASRPAPALAPFAPIDLLVEVAGGAGRIAVEGVEVEAKEIAGGPEGGLAIDTGGRAVFFEEIEITALPSPRLLGRDPGEEARRHLAALEAAAPAPPAAGKEPRTP